MLWENINYTSDIGYLSNCFIYEYDISKANINILYTKGIIDKSAYEYLYSTERMVRQVYVGKLQRDTVVADALKAGIIEAKRMLFEANNIKDYEVLSIKNDAVFIINRQLPNTKFGLIEFKCKNVYTAFYRVGSLEFYYYFNSISKDEALDVKGISNSTLPKHYRYFIQYFKDLFYIIQINGAEAAMNLQKDFYMDYINLNLPVGYYRKFNNDSDYHFKTRTAIGTGFGADNVGENAKPMLDITYNLAILLEMQKILTSMYFTKH